MDAATARRFVDTMREWLISLPHDLKVLFEASTDENLDRSLREVAVGAILYTVSPTDFISSDRDDFTSYADDCLMVRMAMQKLAVSDSEDAVQFRERFDDFFGPLQEGLATCKEAMGAELYDWLEGHVKQLTQLEYKGKKVAAYLDDDEASELLYEDGLAFTTEYPVDEDDLADRFKKASTVIEVLQRRKEEDDRKRAG